MASERVESFRVDGWDEDGFHLHVSSDDGEHDFRITDPEAARSFLAAVAPLELESLADWVAEGDREHAAYMVASPEQRARVLGRALELDDPDAYDERAEAIRVAGDHARKAELETGPITEGPTGIAGFRSGRYS
jgi:hypothetical protein